MKTAFYFRTRNEYNEIVAHIDALNLETQSVARLRNKTLLRMHTRYRSKDKLDNWVWDSKIPMQRVGTKKYIGIILGNCHLMKMCDVRPAEFLRELGQEIVPKIAGVSNYEGDKTTHPVCIKSPQELQTIASVFNKRYGHGNWRIQGPKKLQDKLRQIEPRSSSTFNSFYIGEWGRDALLKKYPNGIPVTLIVKEADANIPKQLFKVVLKG